MSPIHRPLHASLILLATALVAACASSPRVGSEVADGVVYLGQREVAFRVDRDVLRVGPDTGAFRALRFQVDDAPMALYDVVVVFGNGARYSPPTRLVFGEGAWSREIDLPGDARYIRRIEFLYESVGKPRRGRADVRVFGLR